MIRHNPPKPNAQKGVYYTPRFDVMPHLLSTPLNQEDESLLHIKDIQTPLLQSYMQAGLASLCVDSKDLFTLVNELYTRGYEMLTEMSAVDFLHERNEFELFYLLLRLDESSSTRLKIKTKIKKNQSIVSLTPLYKSAQWSERECFDMFGIIFDGHPHLHRLIMPKDWVGHPLLKSYPLHGDEYASWYEVDKIFGKQYRDIIGAEQRDSARIDFEDSKNFSPISFETRYQEESKPAFLKSFNSTKQLKERR